jgi:tyrosyl-tRNA synthetase
VFAWYDATPQEYEDHIRRVLEIGPNIVIDDGGDLVNLMHTEYRELIPNVIGGCEETTTGILRLVQLNKAKEILAYELTKLVHGEEEATKAQEAARALFSAGSSANMPTATITADDFTDGSIDILTLLVKTGLVPSKSEARRAVEQGGVTVDGEKVADIKTLYTPEAFAEGAVVKRGKKNFMKVVVG